LSNASGPKVPTPALLSGAGDVDRSLGSDNRGVAGYAGVFIYVPVELRPVENELTTHDADG
jgi:hypothetical protein